MIDDFSVLQPVFSQSRCNFTFIIIWQVFFVHDFSSGKSNLLFSLGTVWYIIEHIFSEKDVTI